jgi:hypothetical protein
LKPDIKTFAYGGEHGSFYCNPSEIYSLQHEKMIIPLRILDMSYKVSEFLSEYHINNDASKLREFLIKLDTTYDIFRSFGCPKDIINLLYQYTWK